MVSSLLRLSKPSDAPLTWRSDSLINQRMWCKLVQFNQNARAKSDLNLFLPHFRRRKNFTSSSRDQHRKSWRRNWHLVLKYLLNITFKFCEWDDSKGYLSVWRNPRWCFSLSKAEKTAVRLPDPKATSRLRQLQSSRSCSSRFGDNTVNPPPSPIFWIFEGGGI